MAQDLEKLVVELSANVKGFEREMRRARVTAGKETDAIAKGATKASVSISKSFAGIGASIRTGVGGLGLGSVLGGLGLAAIAQQAVKTAASLAKIGDEADRIGITAEALQAVQYAVSQDGGSAEAATAGLQRFSPGLADASTGAGELFKIFEANKVAFKDANGNLLPLQTNLANFAEIAKNAKNDSELLEFAIRAFGRSAGPEMVGVLRKGAEGFKQMGAEAKAAGVIIDEDIIKKAQELDDAMGRWGTAIQAKVLPFLLKAVEFIERVNAGAQAEIQAKSNAGIKSGGFGGNMFDRAEAAGMTNAGSMATPKARAALLRVAGPPVPKPTTSTLPGTGTGSGGGGGGGGGASAAANDLKQLGEAYDRILKSGRERITELEAEQKALGLTAFEAEKLRVTTDLLNRATSAGIELSPTQRAELEKLASTMATVKVKTDEAREAQQNAQEAVRDFGQEGADAFKALILEGQKFSEVLRNLMNRIAGKAIDALFGFGSTGVSSLFAPGKAAGGPVSAGHPYMVGESGRELFVPSSPGRIVPHGKLAGVKPVSISFAPVIDARGADAGQIQQLRAEMRGTVAMFRREAPALVKQAERRRF